MFNDIIKTAMNSLGVAPEVIDTLGSYSSGYRTNVWSGVKSSEETRIRGVWITRYLIKNAGIKNRERHKQFMYTNCDLPCVLFFGLIILFANYWETQLYQQFCLYTSAHSWMQYLQNLFVNAKKVLESILKSRKCRT